MSQALPPLDLHAHVDVGIAPQLLESLGSVVFVATRSPDEYEQALPRTDAVTVWGLGCHPGVTKAMMSYEETRFAALLATAPFISEVGIDGSSSVPMDHQVEVFKSILAQVAHTPRLMSVHSKRAAKRTLDLIEQSGVSGVILHWWLGSEADTRRALDLACLFSVNRSMDVGKMKAAGVPLSSLLPETDHPSGNRSGDGLKQPGWTVDVEQVVASIYGKTPEFVRQQFWDTLAEQVDAHDLVALLPPVVQAMLEHVRRNRD